MNEKILGSLIKSIDVYYAHIGENEKVELLEEHVERTCRYFKKLYHEKQVDKITGRILESVFKNPSDAMKEFFNDMIFGVPIFHDYGKVNPSFQKNIMKNPLFQEKYTEIGEINSTHSLLSSLAYMEYFRSELRYSLVKREEKPLLRFFIVINSYIISRHHSDLSNFEKFQEQLLKNNMEEILKYLGKINGWDRIALNAKQVRSLVQDNYNQVLLTFTQKESIDMYVYTKLIYSMLVASDYYATSEFMNGIQMSDLGNMTTLNQCCKVYEETELMKSIRSYQKNCYPKEYSELMKEKNINILRNEIFCDTEKVLNAYLDENIFYLEAPTGSGKSNAALNLTFQLIKSDESLRKIFYIYPFNTLVEQNINSLNKIFGKKEEIYNEIAVINSLTPIKTDKDKKILEENNECGTYYQKALLDRQFLNYPMILSTHVTLFDTLFGETKESVFGFHQLCNSIIVLDEIQSYKNSIWGEIICFLKEFSFLMNIKLIIMSATLPNLDVLSHEMWPAVRLLPESRKYFEHPCFRNRVTVSYRFMDIENIEDRIFEHIKSQVENGKKVLVEFITKTSAEKFFRRLKEDESVKDYVEYMSGADSIIERKRILDSIERTNKPVILVATQVVEAGVDIDMDVGYKNISKLDSEEQFLGRINRSCKKKNCTVYFFKVDDSKKIYGADEVRTNKNLTLENDEMKEFLVNKDFSTYYSKVLSRLKKNICDNKSNGLDDFFNNKMKKLLFKEVREKMQLISDDNWSMSVFLARNIKDIDGTELSGAQIWEDYNNLLNNFSMDYSEKKIKLSRISSKMACFIYQIKKTYDLVYDDRIGEIYYIENGEDFFQDGKLSLEKIENGVSFI